MLITKDGIIDDGKDEKTIRFNKMTFSVAEFAKTDGVSLQNMKNQITRFILGDIPFNEITRPGFHKKERYTLVGDRMMSPSYLVDLLDCKKATAFDRLNRFRLGKLPANRVTEKIKSNGYRSAKFGSKSTLNTSLERAMLDAIPGNGTWEEENLKPSTFSGNGYGGANIRLNLARG